MTELLASTACTMSATDPRSNGPDVPVYPCDEPAIAVITFACVHEHIDTASACPGCCAEVQQCTGILICPRCEDGPDSHECRLIYEIRWESGEVTRG